MEYISAKEAAEKWGITVRWVQQCCKNGLILGAGRLGNSWIIPKGAHRPETSSSSPTIYGTPLPLMNRSFLPGQCIETVEAIADADERTLALGEYYYFSGQAEKALATVAPLLEHKNIFFRLSANLIFAFSSLSTHNTKAALQSSAAIQEIMGTLRARSAYPRQYAMAVFIRVTSAVLLHLPVPPDLNLKAHLRYLPKGLRLFACYIIAHQHYLNGAYGESFGVAQTALSIEALQFPVPGIYLHLVAAMSLMRLKRTKEAREHFFAAWDLAQPDDLIEAFAEHHGLLSGLVESCLKRSFPADYERVIGITDRFSKGWRSIHNYETDSEVTSTLSTTEFTIATLAARGWTNQEIATHLELSVHTIKNYISIIYQKLHISSRSQLLKYILR